MAHLPKGQGVFLPPFKAWLASNIPAVYDNTMTYYEELCALIKYLQDVVIPALNHNAEAVTTIATAVEQLQKYVEDYFKNLDIQEEINNKLDEMAESGELSEIINNYDKCDFIFPKNWLDGIVSSDANLILNQGKSLMIDVSYQESYSKVVSMLSDNGVTHLDYVIITHWDRDHIGNLKALIANGIIDSESDVYMPLAPSYVDAPTVADYQAYFAEYNIVYKTPTNLQTINVGNVEVTFGNCDLTQDEQYANLSDRKNLMSTCLLIKHKEIKAFYSGDADNEAYEYLYNTGFLKGAVDLFKIGHHGFNTTTFEKFLDLASPKYAVQTAAHHDFMEGDFAFSPSISTLADNGAKIYPTYMSEDYLTFTSDGYNLHVTNGSPFVASQYVIDNTNIYVDINASPDSNGDGSETKPYQDIASAIGSINNYNTRVVTIHLADGSYGTTHPLGARQSSCWITNAKPRVVVTGNSSDNTAVTLNGVIINNSNVKLQNLTVNDKYRVGVAGNNASNIVIDNCIITNPDNEKNFAGVTVIGGSILIKDSAISYATSGITGSEGATITMHNVDFSNITDNTYLNTDHNCQIIERSVHNTDNVPYTNYFVRNNANMLLYRGDGSLNSDYSIGSITLPVNFSELTSIEIELKTSTSRYISSGKIYHPANGMILPMQLEIGSASYIYFYLTEVKLSDDNKLTFQAQYRMRIHRETGTIEYSDYPDGSGNYYFKFINVRGEKEIFNELVSENI